MLLQFLDVRLKCLTVATNPKLERFGKVILQFIEHFFFGVVAARFCFEDSLERRYRYQCKNGVVAIYIRARLNMVARGRWAVVP